MKCSDCSKPLHKFYEDDGICQECWEKSNDIDPHLGCYSWPNCDEAQLGCVVACREMGLEPEPYGHRD